VLKGVLLLDPRSWIFVLSVLFLSVLSLNFVPGSPFLAFGPGRAIGSPEGFRLSRQSSAAARPLPHLVACCELWLGVLRVFQGEGLYGG
jgi:hypothetical protein